MNSGRLLSMIATVSPLRDAERGEPAGDPADLVAQLVPADHDLVVAVDPTDRRVVAEPVDRLLEREREVLRVQLSARAATRVPLRRR